MDEDRISSCALAIFAKTPYLSPVKTRLANDIGEQKATAIYIAMVDCLKTFAHSLPSYISPYFTVAEREALASVFWQGKNLMHSGEGGLGERLHHSYRTLKTTYNYVILIGSDSPHITPQHLKETYNALKTHDYVVGPSFDGGFYLFASRLELPESFWLQPTYSKNSTLNQLIESINRPIYFLEKEHDLDRIADIKPISLSLSNSVYSYHSLLSKRIDKILNNTT